MALAVLFRDSSLAVVDKPAEEALARAFDAGAIENSTPSCPNPYGPLWRSSADGPARKSRSSSRRAAASRSPRSMSSFS